MTLSAYQHRLVNYVKAHQPGYGEDQAIRWLDCYCLRWREDNPPTAQKCVVALGDEESLDGVC